MNKRSHRNPLMFFTPISVCRWAFLAALVFWSLVGCSQQQPPNEPRFAPQAEQGAETRSPEIRSTTTVLAVIPDDEKPGGLEASAGHVSNPAQSAQFTVVFSPYGGGVAYIAQKGEVSYV